MQEKEIIQSFYKKNREESDDCFLLDGKQLVTTDVMAENVHFNTKWSSPADLASKLVEVNVSDIAASGGIPQYAFLNLGLPALSDKWIREYSTATSRALKAHGITLAGGDTFRSEKIYLGMTIIGKTSSPLIRKNAQPGEYVYITGPLGYSLLGYEFLIKNKIDINAKGKHYRDISAYNTSAAVKKGVEKHLRPKSRLNEMTKLNKKFRLSSAIDITDGLVQDAASLAGASKTKIILSLDQLPERSVLDKHLPLEKQVTSGEELEILFTSPDPGIHLGEKNVHLIGVTTKGKGVEFFDNGVRTEITDKGFLHF